MQAGLDRLWPYTDELFEPDDARRSGSWPTASPSTRPAARGLGRATSTACSRGDADRPDDRRRRHRRAATACTPRRSATCSPRCSTCTAATRGRHGDAHARRRAASRGRGGARPRAAGADDRGARRAARGRRSTATASSSTITPTYSGCPAMDADPATTSSGGARRRVSRRRGPDGAVAGLDHRLDQRRGPAQAAGVRHRAARRRRRRRSRSLDARGALPAAAARADTGAQPVRLDRVQGACASAAPAASRSTTSRRSE